MAASFATVVKLLETYRGRDKIIRTTAYLSCLLAGYARNNSQLSERLLVIYNELNMCRAVQRLFDDLSMLALSLRYGIGKSEKDGLQRLLSILSNLVNQAFFPIEHVAWAAQKKIISIPPGPWWFGSLLAWIISLCINILKSSLKVINLQSILMQEHKKQGSNAKTKELQNLKKMEYLSIVASSADLGLAIHWMPGSVLWSGKLSNTAVGTLGVTSSLCGIIKILNN